MKTPTHYFCYAGHGTQPKNNLQKQFQEYLCDTAGTLVKAEDLLKLTEHIRQKSIDLNKEHSRCTPLQISFREPKDGTWAISGFYCQVFYILPATQVEL